MTKPKSRISVGDIFAGHLGTYKMSNDRISRSDKWIFLWFPLLIGLFVTIIFGHPSNETINFLAVIFSVFIGLFLNILILLISSINTKIKSLVEDKKNRRDLIKETFYNISYTILTSLFTLILLIILRVRFFPEEIKWVFNIFEIAVKIKPQSLVLDVISFFCYVIIFNIFPTLISIINQVFKLFEHEIKILEKEPNKEQ